MDALLVVLLIVIGNVLGYLLWPWGDRPPETEKIVTGPDGHDERASEKLVSLIDLLFALVLTLPVIVSEDVVRAPWDSNAPVVLALVLAYYLVIRSFVDWHIAMEDAPYWIRTSPHKSWELRRVYVDFLIVIAYVMLFLSTKELATDPGSDIGEFLFLLAVIVVLYILWGILRRVAYKSQHEFRRTTLVVALVGFAAIWGAYRLDHDQVLWLHHHATERNIIALALAFAVLGAYRFKNWHEIRHIRSISETGTQAEAAEG